MNPWVEKIKAALPDGWEAHWDEATETVRCSSKASDGNTLRIVIQPLGRPEERWWSLSYGGRGWMGVGAYKGRGFIRRMVRDALAQVDKVRS